MESDVVAMTDALHVVKADLVGWRDGGIVMAIRHPDRHVRRGLNQGAATSNKC